jgi:NAD-dependent oxidoreductase involved in siderophore biosynthesis
MSRSELSDVIAILIEDAKVFAMAGGAKAPDLVEKKVWDAAGLVRAKGKRLEQYWPTRERLELHQRAWTSATYAALDQAVAAYGKDHDSTLFWLEKTKDWAGIAEYHLENDECWQKLTSDPRYERFRASSAERTISPS